MYRYFNTKTKVLAELTSSALNRSAWLSADLHALADPPDDAALQAWMRRYVAFRRDFSGVIRAWFDGAAAGHLSREVLLAGIGHLSAAVAAMLDRVTLPADMERRAVTAIFMAVLGRMTEPTEPSSTPSTRTARQRSWC